VGINFGYDVKRGHDWTPTCDSEDWRPGTATGGSGLLDYRIPRPHFDPQ
jgi:hypothetical protein